MQINSTDCFPGKSLISVYFLLSHFECVMPQKLKVRLASPCLWLSQSFLPEQPIWRSIQQPISRSRSSFLASAPESARVPTFMTSPWPGGANSTTETSQRRAIKPCLEHRKFGEFLPSHFSEICKDWFGSSSNWLIQLMGNQPIQCIDKH